MGHEGIAGHGDRAARLARLVQRRDGRFACRVDPQEPVGVETQTVSPSDTKISAPATSAIASAVNVRLSGSRLAGPSGPTAEQPFAGERS